MKDTIKRGMAKVRAVFGKAFLGVKRGAVVLWSRAGFYLALAGCLALIGGGAYALRSRPPFVPENRPMATEMPISESAAANPDSVEFLEDAVLHQEEATRYVWPVLSGGAVLKGHSPDVPVWSETLIQWQPHTGIDLAAPLGEVVVAIADGMVIRAEVDPLLGNLVEIAHDEGLVTRYASLLTLSLVKEGTAVKAGDAIGAVGRSAASESQMDPHLHFEAYRDGVWAPVLKTLEQYAP